MTETYFDLNVRENITFLCNSFVHYSEISLEGYSEQVPNMLRTTIKYFYINM